ncbi:MAK10-like protein [Tanacetum coccineum]
MHLFQFSLCDQASIWLERLRAGSITTWEDLTTLFFAQFFLPGRTAKLRNDILMFQQHHGESLSEAWTRFKDLLQKVPHHGIDLWLQDLAFYENDSWIDPMDFAKSVKAIALPQFVQSTSGRRLIELENQVQRLMEAHLALTQPTQVKKITTSCEICNGPHDTQYCMENPKQAFVEYAFSRTDEAGGNFTYVVDFMIIEDISLIIDPRLSQVVLRRPFIEISNMTHDLPKGVVRFTNKNDEVAYKMPHKIEQYNSLSNLEKEHTKSVYLRNEEDKKRGVDYVISKILWFYKECLELSPEYVTGLDDEGEVTLYLMRRSLKVLRKFHLMILEGRFNQFSHVSSPLLSKPGEY